MKSEKKHIGKVLYFDMKNTVFSDPSGMSPLMGCDIIEYIWGDHPC
jgi:hypothetical protein